MATGNSVETKTTAANCILSDSQVIKVGADGFPTIYKLNFKEEITDQNLRLRKCYIGKPTMINGCPAPEKIIMMVGATGAGKSTMINAFVNYYYGTKWTDNFRLKLITEEDEGINGVAQSQTKSQTKFITAYTLYYQSGCVVPYTLIIIDTPGFGDVDGIKRDEEITNQIREFFMINGSNGIDHLDAIGFVVQNSVNRLSPTQKYIFDSILSIFGKDISSNMFSMITFADGQPPPALKAIAEAEVPSITHFKFNNSALYAANHLDDDEDDTNVDQMFWKIGVASLKKFFIEFQKIQSVSLVLTKEVLTERQQLEAFVQGIQPQIQYGLNKLEELRQEIQVFEDHVNDILKNKSFTYTIQVTKQRKIDLEKGHFVTNCLKCNYTCHYPCGIADDKEKYCCDAMDAKNENSKCTVCPDKCIWNSHVNNAYKFELYQDSEIRTSEDMKERYQKARKDGTTTQNICEILKNDFKETQMNVCKMIGRARIAIERLEQIALRPNPLSVIQYIDLLIMSEQREAKPGWQQRIKHLNEAKQKAEIIQKVKNGNNDDWFAGSSDLDDLDNKFKDLASKIDNTGSKKCTICWEDVQTDKPVEQCNTCHQIYHERCITRWLNTRRTQQQETNCPCCRGDMTWLLNSLPEVPKCSICGQYIGPNSARLTCSSCDSVYHQNELLDSVTQLYNQNQPLICWVCPADMNWVLNLLVAPALLGDLAIQPAEQNNDINNFIWASESEPESEPESESDTD